MLPARDFIFCKKSLYVIYASYNSPGSNQGFYLHLSIIATCTNLTIHPFSSWKGLEQYQGLKARKLLHKVETIKTILSSLSYIIIITMQ